MVGGGTGSLQLSSFSIRYVPMFDSQAASTESAAQQGVPVGGTLSELRVRLDGSPGFPGSWKSYTITVRKNGVSTAVSCTIQDAAVSCSDESDTVTFVADDLISISVTPSGTPTARTMRWTAKFAAQ